MKVVKMGVLPFVRIVYAGMLMEDETRGEAVPSLVVGDSCEFDVFDARFPVGKVIAFGQSIAMESAHGVFLLAAAFALR
jgi:hypothetical protein